MWVGHSAADLLWLCGAKGVGARMSHTPGAEGIGPRTHT